MKGLKNKEDGFSLIEVLIGVAIIGIIAAGFLLAIAGAYKANILADERNTAESIALSQLESIKEQSYIDYSEDVPDLHGVYIEITPPPNYSLVFTVVPLNTDPGIGGDYQVDHFVDVNGESVPVFEGDDGIQRITVTISHQEKEVLTIEQYKAER